MKTLHTENNDTTSFHLDLLSKIINMDRYPVIQLIIENNISREEFEELMQMLQELNEKYEIQKEEGFLHFSSLLIHFVGMLNEKLDPHATIFALKKEGCFPSLMTEFIKIMECEKVKRRR
ncbi:DUF1878 family protein [Virgibacillus ainsalahensis]